MGNKIHTNFFIYSDWQQKTHSAKVHSAMPLHLIHKNLLRRPPILPGWQRLLYPIGCFLLGIQQRLQTPTCWSKRTRARRTAPHFTLSTTAQRINLSVAICSLRQPISSASRWRPMVNIHRRLCQLGTSPLPQFHCLRRGPNSKVALSPIVSVSRGRRPCIVEVLLFLHTPYKLTKDRVSWIFYYCPQT